MENYMLQQSPGRILTATDEYVHNEIDTPVQTNLFVALGLDSQDPGYPIVTESMQRLGHCVSIHESLWLINAQHPMNRVFKQINTSMMDRRIGSASGVFVLNAQEGTTKWYFSPAISEVMGAYWQYRNNFFVAFDLNDPGQNFDAICSDIRALGTWTPISKTLWYVNSSFSSREAFQILIAHMGIGDQLSILDSSGNLATWQDRSGEITWTPEPSAGQDPRPSMAHIHITSPQELVVSRAA